MVGPPIAYGRKSFPAAGRKPQVAGYFCLQFSFLSAHNIPFPVLGDNSTNREFPEIVFDPEPFDRLAVPRSSSFIPLACFQV